jgi:hypothetical protein
MRTATIGVMGIFFVLALSSAGALQGALTASGLVTYVRTSPSGISCTDPSAPIEMQIYLDSTVQQHAFAFSFVSYSTCAPSLAGLPTGIGAVTFFPLGNSGPCSGSNLGDIACAISDGANGVLTLSGGGAFDARWTVNGIGHTMTGQLVRVG